MVRLDKSQMPDREDPTAGLDQLAWAVIRQCPANLPSSEALSAVRHRLAITGLAMRSLSALLGPPCFDRLGIAVTLLYGETDRDIRLPEMQGGLSVRNPGLHCLGSSRVPLPDNRP